MFDIKKIIIALLLIVVYDISGYADNKGVSGVIDFSSLVNCDSNIFKLDGEWEFYSSKLLTPNDFLIQKNLVPEFVTVPGLWNDLPSQKKTGIGYGTYRLKIKFKNTNHKPLYAIKILDCATSYKIWINDELAGSNGIVSDSKIHGRPAFIPQVIPVMVNSQNVDQEITIIMQVSNYHHYKGGIWESLRFGELKKIEEYNTFQSGLVYFIAGFILIMSIYHFILFLLRKRLLASLYFSAFSILMVVRSLVTGERLLVQWFPSINWEFFSKIEYLSAYLVVLLIGNFLANLFKEDSAKVINKIANYLGVILLVFIAVTPTIIFSKYKTVYDMYIILLGLYYGVYLLLKAVIKKREDSFIAFIGMLVLYAAGINDILYNSEIINTAHLAPAGMCIYILSQAFLLSRRFTSAFSTIENLSMELTVKNKELIRNTKIKNDFLVNTSHELIVPLNGIKDVAEGMLDGTTGVLTHEQKNQLSMIYSISRRLSSLVNDILDLERLNNHDLILNKKPIDMYAMTDLILMLSRSLIKGKNIRLVNNVSPEIPWVYADEIRLQQIMHNIIGNSIKFTETGSIEVSANVIDVAGKYLLISINDTGIGIDDDLKDRIFGFKKFDYESGASGTTGLGLAIAKQLVELHNGSIQFTSESGNGTTFTFTIPLATSEQIVKLKETGPMDGYVNHQIEYANELDLQLFVNEDARSSSNSHYRILIVDDDIINLQILCNHLAPFNYTITTASDGNDAIEMIEKGDKFDLMLIDVMMPRISGYQVCKKIRERYNANELPIIMLTAKRLVSDLITGFDAGANDYLIKPFDKREMFVRIQTMLKIKDAYDEHENFIIMQQELDIAQRVQQRVITSEIELKDLGPHKFTISYIPFNKKVGGDYYKIEKLSDDTITIMIADVTGHGIQAALATMQIDIMNRQSYNLVYPNERLKYINNFSINIGGSQKNLFTSFIINIQQNKIHYSSGGHPAQLLIKGESKNIIKLKGEGKILGFMNDIDYELKEESIEKGDILILFTDGIFEEYNKVSGIGYDGFIEIVKSMISENKCNITDVNSYLTDSLKSFMGDEQYNDDITIVTIEIN